MSGRAAAARFFIRIGQAGQAAPKRDEYTLPLFGLPLILEAEGLMSRNAAPRAPVSASPGVQGEGAVSRNGEPLSTPTAIATPAAAAYLAKCLAAIECVDLNLA